jgi:sugar diacid utilization regulator
VTMPARENPPLDAIEHLSKLRGLLALGQLMVENRDERSLLGLAGSSLPSLGPFRLVGIHLAGHGWADVPGTTPPPEGEAARLVVQLEQLPRLGGELGAPNEAWEWAYSLDSAEGQIGHIVVASETEPALWAQFLVGILAQQTSIALANSRLYARQQAQAHELRTALLALENSVAVHDRLTGIAIRGEGEEGIAHALHELTGCPIAIEDAYGNLRAWAGPGSVEEYPQRSPSLQATIVAQGIEAGRPIAVDGQVVAVASPRPDTVGVIAVFGLPSDAIESAQVALEHGTTVLAMELARLQSVADTELRLGRDLVEELLAHDDELATVSRARAMGYDLDRQHQVAVVVEEHFEPREPEIRFHAVRRAARDSNVGTLLVPRGDSVVVLGYGSPDWAAFHRYLVSDSNRAAFVGVGAPCNGLAGFPRSFHEARLALRMRSVGVQNSVIFYEQLGSYRVLAEVSDLQSIDHFIDEWLGSLIAHDDKHSTHLVQTLASYLEYRGRYEATAASLAIHRNTLKYRLRRISEVSNLDLQDGDTLFNLQLAARAWSTKAALAGQGFANLS